LSFLGNAEFPLHISHESSFYILHFTNVTGKGEGTNNEEQLAKAKI
jgi:hypothetical protein